MNRAACVALSVLASVVLATPASGASGVDADRGGCAAFGGNVAMLATALGPAFGETASSVATFGPGAFPALVVHPEQDALCG